MHLYTVWVDALEQRWVRLLSLLSAGFYYLVEPDAAFLAVLIAVLLDLITKLVSIVVNYGGVTAAMRGGYLSSQKAFTGTFVKLIAYFTLGILAAQVQHIANLEVASALSKTVVFSFLFTVESVSILENLVAAGLTELKVLLETLRKTGQKAGRNRE
ncbi:MAG: phage holin family protein [Selenomonadales bacterium]|nr:phage holin family protein [Selenomonadales bacterium]